MTRKEKIQILKDIQAGKKSIDDLKEKGALIIEYENEQFALAGSDKLMTKEEMEQYIQGMDGVIILPDNGRR